MAGSHLLFCTRLAALIKERGLEQKLWLIGGNIPVQDHQALREIGLDGIFPTGTHFEEIISFIRENAS
jgi:methylmalonyl-CoA mutase C-terminal domain/subunit